MNKFNFLYFLFAFLFFVNFSYAQQTTTTPSENKKEKPADVEITAKIQAKELIFEVVPNPKVEFPGTFERETEWSSERTNLPDEVQPKVIYRDIGITLKIVSTFADIEKIVDEALGIKLQTSQTVAPKPEIKPAETKPADDKTKKPETTDSPKN